METPNSLCTNTSEEQNYMLNCKNNFFSAVPFSTFLNNFTELKVLLMCPKAFNLFLKESTEVLNKCREIFSEWALHNVYHRFSLNSYLSSAGNINPSFSCHSMPYSF